MTSEISKILKGYREALDHSRERYEDMYKERFENAKIFYEDFFKDLIIDYGDRLDRSSYRLSLKDRIEEIFGSDKLRFAAIDGTSYKTQLEDYMVFFGASYAVRGEISFEGDPPSFKYERWSTEQDVSLVAYIPVPFAELGDMTEEDQFITSDDDRINLSFIHNQLMQLAEVYLAYDLVKASSLRPKYLLWDHSMSSVFNSNYVKHDRIDLVGYRHGRSKLTPQDIILSYSHPYNEKLDIPSKKKYKAYDFVLKKLQKEGTQKLSSLSEEMSIEKEELLQERIKNYILNDIGGNPPLVYYDQTTEELSFNREYEGSWEYVISLFEKICKKLFKEKDPSALIYTKEEDGEEEERWMSPYDLNFLISVGIRALIEECWENEVMMVGITKDSSSQYLSKNYLGIMRNIGEYSFEDTSLPWTDRTFLEVLPMVDEDLNAPWSTIEFDSVYMTLNLKEIDDSKKIQGVRGNIVAPSERLFSRSLAQFYLSREKKIPNFGHVIFIDRLLDPRLDNHKNNVVEIENEDIGVIKPFTVHNSDETNTPQDVNIYILDVLTRNLYPEVIGYPDPLHKADWGAKSINKKVKPLIKNSDVSLKSNPLKKTLRDLRDQTRRV